MRAKEIVEARRNPEMNRRSQMIDALNALKDKDNLYVSFTHDVGNASHGTSSGATREYNGVNSKSEAHNTSGAKIGINPLNEYNTPTAIYTYPLNYVLERGAKVEFGEERPFLIVVKRVTPKVLNLAEATSQDLEHVCSVLREKYGMTEAEQEDFITRANQANDASRIWNVIRQMARIVFDRRIEQEFLYQNPEYRNVKERPKYPGKDSSPEILDQYGKEFHAWHNDYAAVAQYENKVSAFSEFKRDLPERKGYQSTWNKMLRDCGYECVIDPGLGIIHGNEKTQTIFLTKSALKVVEVINNNNWNMRYHTRKKLVANPNMFMREFRRGHLKIGDVTSILSFLPDKYSEEVIDVVTKEQLAKMIKTSPSFVRIKHEKIYQIIGDLGEDLNDEIINARYNIPDQYFAERISKVNSFATLVADFDIADLLGSLSQRALAAKHPEDYVHTVARNHDRGGSDLEALKIAYKVGTNNLKEKMRLYYEQGLLPDFMQA